MNACMQTYNWRLESMCPQFVRQASRDSLHDIARLFPCPRLWVGTSRCWKWCCLPQRAEKRRRKIVYRKIWYKNIQVCMYPVNIIFGQICIQFKDLLYSENQYLHTPLPLLLIRVSIFMYKLKYNTFSSRYFRVSE